MMRLAPLLLLAAMLVFAACSGGPVQTATPDETDAPAVTRDTYLTLGDSVAAGIGASTNSQSYASELFGQLSAADPTLSRHLNFAIPGATSASLLGEQMDAALTELASGRVRLVSLAIGANDLLALLTTCQTDLLSETCSDNAARQVDIVEDNLQEAVERIAAADPEVEIVLLDYYNPLAPVFPDTAGYVADLNSVLQERAEADELPIVEVFPSFDGHERELTHIDARDVHPNDAGHQLIADLAAALILERGVLG